MFYPAKMCKVRLIAPKSGMRKAIEALEAYGGAEIKKFSSSQIQNAKTFSDHEELVERLLKTEAILSALQNSNGRRRLGVSEAKEFLKSKEFRETERRVGGINLQREQLETELENLMDLKARLRLFSGFNIDFSKAGAQSIELAAGLVQSRKRDAVLEILKKPGNVKHVEKPAQKNASMFVVALPKGSDELLEELSKAGFERVTMPEMNGTAQQESGKTEKKIAATLAKKAELTKELGKISSQSYSKIAAAKEMLEAEVGKSGAALSLGSTEHTFIAEAYLPEKNYDEFAEHIKEKFGEMIEIRKFSSSELEQSHEEAPTLLEHSKAASPFEFMTKYVSVPRSGEIDPTVIFIIFFPVFYGMMVGDVVYGVISFLLARFLLKKTGPESIMRPVCQIWMWSAIPTIIFGIIYDEFMGMPHGRIMEILFGLEHFALYRGIERLHETQFLLAVSILIGVVTMSVGFFLGFLNARKHGHSKHAIAKLGWLGITVFGTLAVAGGLFNALPQEFVLPAEALFALSVIVTLATEGFMALIEIPSVVGNVISFARILAVGLVGVVIALILNDMAFPSPDKGILLIVLVPLYVIGHLFNAFLAMFESFIQGARLNYVELYSKFYEGGGREFSPFRFARRYLKED